MAGLLFLFVWESLYPFLLKDNFTEYRILRWQFFSFNSLNSLLHSFLAWALLREACCDAFLCSSVVQVFFSYAFFKIFWVFDLNMVHLSVGFSFFFLSFEFPGCMVWHWYRLLILETSPPLLLHLFLLTCFFFFPFLIFQLCICYIFWNCWVKQNLDILFYKRILFLCFSSRSFCWSVFKHLDSVLGGV